MINYSPHDRQLEAYINRSKIFSLEIGQAINANDANKIKDLIISDSYPELTFEEKEWQAFVSTYIVQNKELLKYFIFDYQIKEKYFLENLKNMNEAATNMLGVSNLKDEVIKMFEIRNLKNDLSKALDDTNQINKGLKV